MALPAALVLSLPLFALTETVAALPAVAGETDAACTNAPDGSSTLPARHLSGGTRENVARRAASHWFPSDQVDMATAIAGGESSWEPTAVNKAAGGNYGLWQINAIHSDLLQGRNWQDPEVNAWMAYQVWDAADGTRGDHHGAWTPWSVYTSGSYRAYARQGARLPKEAPTRTAVTPSLTVNDCQDTGGPGLRVGTWNVQGSNSLAHIAAGTQDLTAHADVFGLQELGDATRRAAAARGATGFTMTTDHTAVPILYRTSQYTLLDQGRQLAYPAGARVERSSQDRNSVMGPKWVTWVHLQDKATAQSFYVLNTHLLVGAENSVQNRRAHPRRVALYDRQLSALTTLADRFHADGSTVYATCDCNVNYSPKVAPVVTMAEHDLVPSWQSLDSPATHGKRAIDYVWSTQAPASQVTGPQHGSDHAFLAVTFLPSATNVITGGAHQDTARTRVVTDPTSSQTYEVPVPEGRNGTAINFALDQIGKTWRWGSHGPDAWDCSGLTAAAWQAAGVAIIPQSDEQERTVRHVSLALAQPGDLVWHKGYVGVYLGTVGDQRVIIGSVRAQGAVVIHTLDDTEIKAVLRPTA